MRAISPTHVFRLLATLGLCSMLSVGLSVGRMVLTRNLAYSFLSWNLLLAWVPLGLALLLVFPLRRASSWARGATLLAWFLFFPNAPYLITDLIHLVDMPTRTGAPVVFDSLMLFSFALSGLLTGFWSLRIVAEEIRRTIGRMASFATVVTTLTASGFGVYLGRFDRYNSWDVLTQPVSLLRQTASHLLHVNAKAFAVTVVFAAFLGVAYVALTEFTFTLRPTRR